MCFYFLEADIKEWRWASRKGLNDLCKGKTLEIALIHVNLGSEKEAKPQYNVYYKTGYKAGGLKLVQWREDEDSLSPDHWNLLANSQGK